MLEQQQLLENWCAVASIAHPWLHDSGPGRLFGAPSSDSWALGVAAAESDRHCGHPLNRREDDGGNEA